MYRFGCSLTLRVTLKTKLTKQRWPTVKPKPAASGTISHVDLSDSEMLDILYRLYPQVLFVRDLTGDALKSGTGCNDALTLVIKE